MTQNVIYLYISLNIIFIFALIGNTSIEDAMNWIFDHENDISIDIDEMLSV